MNESIRSRAHNSAQPTYALRRSFPALSFEKFVALLIDLSIASLLVVAALTFEECLPIGFTFGALVVSVPVLWGVLPARIVATVDTAATRVEVTEFIRDKANQYGYKNEKTSIIGNQVRFSTRWPGYIIAGDNTLRIEEAVDGIQITGPAFAMTLLGKAVQREFSHRLGISIKWIQYF